MVYLNGGGNKNVKFIFCIEKRVILGGEINT